MCSSARCKLPAKHTFMSKKTLFFSIVLIIVATFVGSRLLTKDVDYTFADKSRLLSQMVNKDEWIISTYDAMMQSIGEQEGQDWILMSAIAYHETRFREDLTSQKGAIGLMQIMPIVGRQFNVDTESIADTETNIRLAGKLLRQIEKTLKLDPSTAESDRMSIILACYNGGIGHVTDARRLAKSNGENPNSWEVVARYLRLKADPAIYESELVRHGKFSGSSRTEAYVRDVMKRYEFYRKLADKGPDMIARVK